MPGQQRWTVTVDPACSLAAVRAALVDEGCTIESALEEIGVLVVSADAATGPKLREIDGVLAVEADDPIDIGPPGGPDTW